MSPDPPRGDPDSAEDLLHSEEVYFMPIGDMEDEDFMADEHGPHELDFSDHENNNNNSDFSDDEQQNNPEEAPQPVDPGQARMMARYQLLIPMPPSEVIDTSVSEEIQPPDQTLQTSPPQEIISKEEKKEGGKKREIDLTDNQVELIKNAMKGFTLPASSIPQWAEEVDESKWKETLVSAIQKNSSSDSTVKVTPDESISEHSS